MAGRWCSPIRCFGLALTMALCCPPSLSGAGDVHWTVEVFVGVSFHLPAPLTIRQSRQEDLKLTGRYLSKSLDRPIYYGWRIGRWRDDSGWELEFVHDKLYLANKPGDVQEFSISHGFNLLTVNRSRDRGGLVERLGAGVVIAHPESTVRGERFPEDGGLLNRGYFLSGPTVRLAAGKPVRISGDLFAPVEGKFSASFARIPVAGGDADVTDLSFQGAFGIGYGR